MHIKLEFLVQVAAICPGLTMNMQSVSSDMPLAESPISVFESIFKGLSNIIVG